MKVSVITCTYNRAGTIENTLQSVLQQSYPNIEYIIVDGGSTDHTLDVVKKYEPLFGSRLRWISEPDQGIYDAMNKGILLSTGDIVGILNSDDYFTSPEVIQCMVDNFVPQIYDAVYGDVHFIRDGQPDTCIRYYSGARFNTRYLRFGFAPPHASLYCKRQVLLDLNLYKTDYKIGADFELMVRLFAKYKVKAKYINMDFVTMRIGGISTKNASSYIISIKECVRACKENGIYTNAFLIAMKFFYKILGFKRSIFTLPGTSKTFL